jgi:hypothetical protein
MPPPRRRRRVQLSAYDRELLQAMNDRRLDRDDPEVQAVLQRLEQVPGREPWQTADVRVQPEAPPPPSSFEPDVALTRAGQAGREGVVSLLPRRYGLFDEPEDENRPRDRGDPYTMRSFGRDVVEHAAVPAWDVVKGIATQPVGSPHSPAIQDALRERGLPTDPRIHGILGAYEAAVGAPAVMAGALYDLATGETDPGIADPVHDPQTWQRMLEERGAEPWLQNLGRLGDVVLDPIDLALPGASAVTGLLGVAMGTGRAVGRTVRAATKVDKLIPAALRSLQDVLPAKNWNMFRRGVENTPGATRAVSHLLPAEIEPLTRSAGGVRRFMETYEQLPDIGYFTAAVRRGAPKKGWYEDSRQALVGIFGDDADMFTGLLAATSPQTSVESNLENALNIFVNWRAAGRPTGENEILNIMARSVQGSGSKSSVLEAWQNNTVRALQGGQSISGPKIDQFWLALRERELATRTGTMAPQQAMVLDAWMANLMGADQKLWSGALTKANAPARLATGDAGAKPTYLAGVSKMREAAKKVGVDGAEAQEMAWSTAMALYDQSSSLSMSAREVLERGLLTDQVVSGTPDFATLLRSPQYANILGRDPSLASGLSAYTPPATSARTGRAGAVPIAMSDADNRNMLRVADTLDGLREMRVTNTGIHTPRVPPGKIATVVPSEVTTDSQWSSLAGSGTPGNDPTVVSDVFGLMEDIRLQNPIAKAATGRGTSEVTRGTGWYRDDTGVVQQNKVRTLGQLLDASPTGATNAQQESALNAARDMVAGATGQSTAATIAINPSRPRAQHNAATIYARGGGDIKEPEMVAFAQGLGNIPGPGNFIPVHSGRSVRVLRLDDDFIPTPMSTADESAVAALAQQHLGTRNAKGKMVAPTMETGENVSRDPYGLISEGADEGSGVRTGRMLGTHWQALKPRARKRLDAEIMRFAKGLLKTYDMPRIRLERPDEARMIEILASSGGSGLAKAREAGIVLPVLAALGFNLTQGEES